MEVAMRSDLEALKKRLYNENRVKNIKFFPGESADAQPEDMAREINKFFADPGVPEGEDELSTD
jgi:hypothetical protein